VSIETLPPALKKELDVQRRPTPVEAAPKGDAKDNARCAASSRRFAVSPPMRLEHRSSSSRAASSVVTAFLQAGILSVVAIALILFVALRRGSMLR